MSKGYFASLYEASVGFVSSLGLPMEPIALNALLHEWRPRLEEQRAIVVERFYILRREMNSNKGLSQTRGRDNYTSRAVGLNTVGMLCDRLTVLTMKGWVLENRLQLPEKARELRETQVDELLDSLANLRPGHSSFTQKISTLKYEATASSWEDVYYGLLTTNVMLWEAQEVLYAGQIDHVECEELRRYIAWFSEGNILRNEYIAMSETYFWGDLVR